MRNKKKVLVLGNYATYKKLVGGQIARTHNVYKLVEKNQANLIIKKFDIQKLYYKKLSVFELIRLLHWCDILIYLPGVSNLKYLYPVIESIKSIKSFSITHVAIGGWLGEFLKSNKKFVKRIYKFSVVLVQTQSLKEKLIQEFNFTNVQYFPNFRITTYQPNFREVRKFNEESPMRIVFMARVTLEKGIDVLFDIAQYIQQNPNYNKSITIDFYGPIEAKDKEYFETNISLYDFTAYKGIAASENVHEVLGEYDVLLLPTRHEGEGFPGTILDAYLSGIPVVVSEWKFLPEFVEQNSTGFICKLGDNRSFYDRIIELYENPHQLYEMKKNAHQKSYAYSEDIAWNVLEPYLA